MRLIDANRLKLILMFNSIDPLEAIDNMPTVEPKRKTGKWIREGWEVVYLRCSVCGYRDYAEEHNNFCPNCGADMRGEKDE